MTEPIPNDPVSLVRWVPLEMVKANDYNPNSVAAQEMKLLYLSIKADGFTQPIVTVWDDVQQSWIIVDGFHRYLVCKTYPDIAAHTGGRVPIVVIDKPINDRMASTVRHNRARGKHSVDGMASMVFGMLDNGWGDAEICNEIGLEAEELVRLKHVTGFSKLYENVEYRRSWVTSNQIRLKREWEARNEVHRTNGSEAQAVHGLPSAADPAARDLHGPEGGLDGDVS